MNTDRSIRRAGIRLPSTESLRAFEAVARLGSCERAAQELNLTPSAVSKRIGSLEEVMGATLFIRKANSLELNELGVGYVGQISEVLRALISMPQHARSGVQSGRLRISSTPTFARQVLAQHLSEFTRAHPGVELEIVVIPPLLDYPATNADVEIRNGDTTAAGGIPLVQDVVTPLASPSFLSARHLPSEKDLRDVPLIRTPLESWLPWFRAAQLDWVEPFRGPKFLDLGLTFEAAANGDGVALCRPALVRDWLSRGALVPMFDVFARPTNQYYVFSDSANPAAQSFVRWLQVLYSGLADSGIQLVRDGLRAPRP